MSRLYDYALVTVVSLISFVAHTISVELFAPESKLHEIASRADQFNGAEKADLWFEILAIYAPLIVIAGICTWAMFREWRRQTTTATRPRPR